MRRAPLVFGFFLAAGAGTGLYLLGSSGADHPGEWDARIAPIAEFVENERRLEFEHPVEVRFLSDADFRREVTTGAGEISAEEREEIQRLTGVLRALGLLRTEIDLLKEVNELSARGVLGFYDPESDEVAIRGTDLTVGHRATLAHELTHVLQDQHFGLDRFEDTDRQFGPYQALAEGDASRVEDAYVQSLSRKEQRRHGRSQQEELDAAALEDFPPVLVDLLVSPYVLGEGLLAVLTAQAGDAVDDAFREPPTSDEHLLDPWTYLAGDEPEDVTRPALRPGERAVELSGESSGDFGALGWYLLLAAQVPPPQALAAVDGWGGDAYVAFERDERTCVRAAFRGEDRNETDEMREALSDWVDASAKPDRRFRTVEPRAGDGTLVTLTSCDPGARGGGRGEQGRSVDEGPLMLPLVRTLFTVGVTEAGVPERTARCGIRRLIESIPTAELLAALETPDPGSDFTRRARAAFEDCRDA